MNIGELIREYRENNDLAQREFAAKAGISNAMISYIERNVNPSTNKPMSLSFETYLKIANAMGMDITELFKTVDSAVDILPANIQKISKIQMKTVPLIGSVAAGGPILATEEHSVVISAPDKADYALEIVGESMVPTYLPGDIIYIREQPTIDYDGQVAVVLLDDEATVKHIYPQKDGLLLISDNPAYAPMMKKYEDYSVIKILGKVCGFTRMYR